MIYNGPSVLFIENNLPENEAANEILEKYNLICENYKNNGSDIVTHSNYLIQRNHDVILDTLKKERDYFKFDI